MFIGVTVAETREQKFARLFPWIVEHHKEMGWGFVYADNWADPEEYDLVPLSQELQIIKQQLIDKYITPYKTARWGKLLPGYVLKRLVLADKSTGTERVRLIQWAREGAESSYLSARAIGEIKVDDPNAEPMPEEVKERLRDLNQLRREEKKLKQSRIESSAPKAKLPIFKDLTQQQAAQAKYPWIILGTFAQDPEKPGGTIVQIQCQAKKSGCEKVRTIHLADAFQVKTCKSCKNKKA
jgi:hypothetical protein